MNPEFVADSIRFSGNLARVKNRQEVEGTGGLGIRALDIAKSDFKF
jgi:hypothetical protein